MASLPLVYVHGAGRQPSAPTLKRQLDGILFGADMPTTRVAYYADVRWGPPPAGAGVAAAAAAAAAVSAPSDRARRRRAIRSSMSHEITPTEAADAIVDATLGTSRRRARGAGAAAEAGVPAATPADTAAARRLVRQLYRRADHVAARSAVPTPGVALGVTFPDPIFRLVVGVFASDVIDYLYGPSAEAMREPVRRALLADPPPRVIVAHSLGTIILYDVLSEPGLAHLPCGPARHGRLSAGYRQRPGSAAPRGRAAEPGAAGVGRLVELRRPVRSGGDRPDPARRVQAALRRGRRGQQRRPQQPRPDRISADRAGPRQDHRRFRSVTRRPARPG